MEPLNTPRAPHGSAGGDGLLVLERSTSNPGGAAKKVVLVGEEGVGKTSIFERLRRGVFNEFRVSTRGIDQCVVQVQDEAGHQIRNINLWDTAGSEKYGSVTLSYYRDSAVIVLVYSLDSKLSLPKLHLWLADARMFAPNAYMLLVGNKWDLLQDLEPQDVAGRRAALQFQSNFATEIKAFCPISAKTNDGVDTLKDTICSLLVQKETEDAQRRRRRPTRRRDQDLVDEEIRKLSQQNPPDDDDDKRRRRCCSSG